VEQRKGKTSQTQPETPAARLSSPPEPRGSEAPPKTGPPSTRVPQSDFKSLLPDDAGRYSKQDKSEAGVLSPRERALLAKLREQAPCLARLVGGSVDAGQARDALHELDMLLTGKREETSPR
jgi:hypothetical protein